jgi:hypothetical protein
MALGAVALFGGDVARAAETSPAAATAGPECWSSNVATTTVTVGGKSIQVLCGGDYEVGETWFEYQGRKHAFVIRASDRAVSHIWETCVDCETYSSWTSLGGTAMGRVWYRIYDSQRALEIKVYGTDSRLWCREYNSPGLRSAWTYWHNC